MLSFCNHMLPKRRFWTTEQTFGNVFSKYFSRVWVLDLGDGHLKSGSSVRSMATCNYEISVQICNFEIYDNVITWLITKSTSQIP